MVIIYVLMYLALLQLMNTYVSIRYRVFGLILTGIVGSASVIIKNPFIPSGNIFLVIPGLFIIVGVWNFYLRQRTGK